MTITIASRAQTAVDPAQLPRIIQDRRRHRRVPLALLGRYMRADKQEFPCTLIEISVSGMSVTAPSSVEPGEQIITYFDELGGLQGEVVRATSDGFALRLNITPRKREKLAAQLTWLINREDLSIIEARAHQRTPVESRAVTLKLPQNIEIECQVIDISISGASVRTTSRPQIGSVVYLGKQKAQVVRHHELGIGLHFDDRATMSSQSTPVRQNPNSHLKHLERP